jgi:hypothetical protein
MTDNSTPNNTEFPYGVKATNTPGPNDVVRFTQGYVDDLITRQNENALAALSEKNLVIEELRASKSDLFLAKSRIMLEFDDFKRDVRQAILHSVIRDEEKTDLLDQLDLPGIEQDYLVEVTVSQTFSVRVTAESEDAAIEKVESEMGYEDVAEFADQWDWDVETTGTVTLENN